ncbi:TMV resistance protein N-like [Neltuma alba]|uniref:TMV resistance protein N-like n=1 Tax=Neltuma alba TaxID=207710 RepID=UPI0010A583FA|nr:TMV resistance protein N-like [Prosopis alba]
MSSSASLASSSSSSSSSSYDDDSQYYSAIPSPSTREFIAHDAFIVSGEDVRTKLSPSAAPSSSSSSSQCSPLAPSPSTKENAHRLSVNSYRSEDDSRLMKSWSPSIASSSTSSQTSSTNPSPCPSHHVFISFRGEDTRNGFVSHLRAAFTRHGIRTYMDCDLERGNEISSTLLVAIKQSKILLLVFSERYADSRWTLDELTKIMECKRTRGQHVIPIFYKVRPSDVRHQRGTYETAFKRHKKLFKANNDTVQQWTTAMTEAANLSGWECSGSRVCLWRSL